MVIIESESQRKSCYNFFDLPVSSRITAYNNK